MPTYEQEQEAVELFNILEMDIYSQLEYTQQFIDDFGLFDIYVGQLRVKVTIEKPNHKDVYHHADY